MGYHEQCVECKGDMCDGVGRGETCRECLTKRIAELEYLLNTVRDRREQFRMENKALKTKLKADDCQEGCTKHLSCGIQTLKEKLKAATAVIRDAEVAFVKLMHLNASVVQPIAGKVIIDIATLIKSKCKYSLKDFITDKCNDKVKK